MTRYSEHTVTARAVVGDTTLELSPEDAGCRLSDSWSPYISGTLTVALPPEAEIALIDPRTDTRLSILFDERIGQSGTLADLDAAWAAYPTLADLDLTGGYTTLADIDAQFFQPWNEAGDGSQLHLDVGLRGRELDHKAGTMTLNFASDEALLDDYALMSTVSETPGSTSVKTAAQYVLGKIGATLDVGATDGTVDEADALVWYPGTSAWEYISSLAQAAGLRLWCDESRVWHLDPRDALIGDVVVLSEFTEARDRITRDGEWYDGVVVEYDWTDDAGVRRLRRDIAGGAGASRVLRIQNRTPYPGKGAAKRILDRATRRGRVLDMAAVSRYTTRPSNPLTARPPAAEAQTGVVESVTFTWPGDRMSVLSRGLVDTDLTAWLMIPQGERWLDQPVGGTWLNEQIGF